MTNLLILRNVCERVSSLARYKDMRPPSTRSRNNITESFYRVEINQLKNCPSILWNTMQITSNY